MLKHINGSVYWIENGHKEYLYPVGYEYEPSEACLKNIKQYEGWHEGWKKDPKGYLTTGWGFKQTRELLKLYPKGMSRQQADDYFINTAIPERVKQFRDCMKDIMFYNQNQMDALFDLLYNVGFVGFTKDSPKLQKALRERDIENILKEMNHGETDEDAPGLKVRRDKERALFMKPINSPIQIKESQLREMIRASIMKILNESSNL